MQDLSFTTVSPSSVGENGGQEIVLEGNGFPTNVDTLYSLMMCGVTPTLLSMSNTEIRILAPPCPAGTDTITLDYNGETATINFDYTAGGSPSADIFSISPVSRSPVLKGVMNITGTGFGTDMSKITVHLANSTGKVYPMRVLQV